MLHRVKCNSFNEEKAKERDEMILLAIILLAILILTAVVIVAVSIGGSVFILIFGDVIVCIVFLILLVRWLIKRRK